MLTANAVRVFGVRLLGSACTVYTSDLRVCLDRKAAYAHPDLTVVCGDLEFTDQKQDTVANPMIVAEVLSPSTRDYDLGPKLRYYWKIPSLTHVILIEQQRVWIEHWFRAPGETWTKREAEDRQAVLELQSVNCEIPVAELYASIQF